jgi:hypothetical protein
VKKSKMSGRSALAVVILALLSLASVAQAQGERQFLGSWKGNISIMTQTLEVRFVFTLDEAKKIKGTFDSITQGAAGLNLGDIKIEGKNISFIIADLAAQGNPTFKGTLDKTGTKVTGDFTQAGYTGTFSVEKEKPQK